jgi:hypothetical protein
MKQLMFRCLLIVSTVRSSEYINTAVQPTPDYRKIMPPQEATEQIFPGAGTGLTATGFIVEEIIGLRLDLLGTTEPATSRGLDLTAGLVSEMGHTPMFISAPTHRKMTADNSSSIEEMTRK